LTFRAAKRTFRANQSGQPFSASSQRSLRLRGEETLKFNHGRDAELAEEAERISDQDATQTNSYLESR